MKIDNKEHNINKQQWPNEFHDGIIAEDMNDHGDCLLRATPFFLSQMTKKKVKNDIGDIENIGDIAQWCKVIADLIFSNSITSSASVELFLLG